MTNHPAAIDPDAIYHQLDELGLAFADADAAYKALDDATKTVLAEVMVDFSGTEKSSAAQETHARASRIFKDHLAAVAAARRTCNRARVRYDSLKAWVELKRTAAATDRAMMNLR